jgi:transposase-like protein
MRSARNPYIGFRFPAEIIEHAVWLYHCFSLSLRDVELICEIAAKFAPCQMPLTTLI